jgi:pyridoxal phosphate enzyme (YggS family)
METAARRAGRDPESVRLVVVTKTHPVETVWAAIEAGAKVLGENYAEEAVAKMNAIGQAEVEWHMIGHVQSRKAKLVAENFGMMHSLDSLKLARRLDNFAAEAGRVLPILLEFNVGGEASKSGWEAGDESRWEGLLPEVETILSLGHLETRGLMTMPPLGEQAEASRAYFVRLRRLQDFLRGHFPQSRWDELSMGTSLDFTVAIEEGATLVRVGTSILGPRS